MRRLVVAIVLLAALKTSSNGQSLPIPQPRAWSDHLRNSTVSLGRATTIDGKYAFDPIGTGVLVAKNTSITQYLAIVTAKHVLESLSSHGQSSIRVRFASEETKPLNQDYGYQLRLTDKRGKNVWRSLPDGSDIALIPIDDSFMLQFASQMPKLTDAIGIQDLAETADIYEGENIVVFGFPSDVSVLMGEDALVHAVVRSGIVAWVNPNGTDEPFMIDANILQGNSGGPVFKIPTSLDKFGSLRVGGGAQLLGIVTNTVGNEYVRSIGGLGRVEPASKIRDLINITFPKF